MKAYWLQRAWHDRRSQLDYIAARNPAAALALGDALAAAVQQLQHFPESAPEGRIPGTRELQIAHSPWLLVYRVGIDRVEILRLLHTAQKWP